MQHFSDIVKVAHILEGRTCYLPQNCGDTRPIPETFDGCTADARRHVSIPIWEKVHPAQYINGDGKNGPTGILGYDKMPIHVREGRTVGYIMADSGEVTFRDILKFLDYGPLTPNPHHFVMHPDTFLDIIKPATLAITDALRNDHVYGYRIYNIPIIFSEGMPKNEPCQYPVAYGDFGEAYTIVSKQRVGFGGAVTDFTAFMLLRTRCE